MHAPLRRFRLVIARDINTRKLFNNHILGCAKRAMTVTTLYPSPNILYINRTGTLQSVISSNRRWFERKSNFPFVPGDLR